MVADPAHPMSSEGSAHSELTREAALARSFSGVVKPDDGFVATFLSALLANRLLRRIAHTRVHPNQVTILSAACAVAASVSFATGSMVFLVLGAVLLQLAFVLDCLDGQLARFRGESTAFGAWLDQLTDRLKDLVLFAGIAFGCAARGQGASSFLWSYLALAVVFYRHFDSLLLASTLGPEYRSLLHDPSRERTDPAKVRIIEAARERRKREWGPFAKIVDRLAPKGTHEENAVVFWAKRALRFDGGERYLLISVLAAAGRLEWIFPAIVVWGGIVYPLVTLRRWLLFGSR